jgi:hypothetical protein
VEDKAMQQIQIVVRCEKEPGKHAKILRLRPDDSHLYAFSTPKEWAENLARLLDGTSAFYIHKPGPDSPIGKCATCGGKLTVTVEEIEVEDAKSKG